MMSTSGARWKDALEIQHREAVWSRNGGTLKAQIPWADGSLWEMILCERARFYLAPLLRRLRVLSQDHVLALLDDAVAAGTLTDSEADEISCTGLICSGRYPDDNSAAYLAVEVWADITPPEVLRAVSSAELLSRLGVSAMPVIAGKRITPEAQAWAVALGVWQVSDEVHDES